MNGPPACLQKNRRLVIDTHLIVEAALDRKANKPGSNP